MNMKNIPLYALIISAVAVLTLSPALSADSGVSVPTETREPLALTAAQEILNLPAGHREASFGYSVSDFEFAPTGPSTFLVSGNQMLLLDSLNNRLAWFSLDDGRWLRDTVLPRMSGDHPIDLAIVGAGQIAVLYPETPAVFVINVNGEVILEMNAAPPTLPLFKVPSRIYGGVLANIWAVDPGLGLTMEYDFTGTPVRVIRGEYSVISGNPALFREDFDYRSPNRLKIFCKNPGEPDERLFHAVYRPGIVHKCEIFNRDSQGNVYALLIWGDMDITANAEVLRINPEGQTTGRVVIPDWPGFASRLHVRNTEDGHVIYMLLDEKNNLSFRKAAFR